MIGWSGSEPGCPADPARRRTESAGRKGKGAGELRALTELRERFAAEARGGEDSEETEAQPIHVQIGEKDECRGKCRNELANSDHSAIRHGSPVAMSRM